MTKWGQVGTILAIILTIACLALGVMYYQENERRVSIERNLVQTQEEVINLKTSLNQKEQTIGQLNQSMKELQLEFNLKLEQKDTEITNLNSELQEVKNERGSLETDYSKLKGLRRSLEKRLNQVKVEREELQQRIMELEKRNELLLAKSKSSGGGAQLSLEQIVVQESPTWQGEVLAVDNEYGYAVVGLGMKNNLPESMVLGIFRGEENIGLARVVKLYENTSVVKIIKQNREIQEADIVKNVEQKEKNYDF